ncbi:hypothetical protein Emag_002697 [Eimeria magna]
MGSAASASGRGPSRRRMETPCCPTCRPEAFQRGPQKGPGCRGPKAVGVPDEGETARCSGRSAGCFAPGFASKLLHAVETEDVGALSSLLQQNTKGPSKGDAGCLHALLAALQQQKKQVLETLFALGCSVDSTWPAASFFAASEGGPPRRARASPEKKWPLGGPLSPPTEPAAEDWDEGVPSGVTHLCVQWQPSLAAAAAECSSSSSSLEHRKPERGREPFGGPSPCSSLPAVLQPPRGPTWGWGPLSEVQLFCKRGSAAPGGSKQQQKVLQQLKGASLLLVGEVGLLYSDSLAVHLLIAELTRQPAEEKAKLLLAFGASAEAPLSPAAAAKAEQLAATVTAAAAKRLASYALKRCNSFSLRQAGRSIASAAAAAAAPAAPAAEIPSREALEAAGASLGPPVTVAISGETPVLLQAAINRDLNFMELLLKNGASPDVFLKASGLPTPLFFCVFWGFTPAVRLLLSHGANPFIIKERRWASAALEVAKKARRPSGAAAATAAAAAAATAAVTAASADDLWGTCASSSALALGAPLLLKATWETSVSDLKQPQQSRPCSSTLTNANSSSSRSSSSSSGSSSSSSSSGSSSSKDNTEDGLIACESHRTLTSQLRAVQEGRKGPLRGPLPGLKGPSRGPPEPSQSVCRLPSVSSLFDSGQIKQGLLQGRPEEGGAPLQAAQLLGAPHLGGPPIAKRAQTYEAPARGASSEEAQANEAPMVSPARLQEPPDSSTAAAATPSPPPCRKPPAAAPIAAADRPKQQQQQEQQQQQQEQAVKASHGIHTSRISSVSTSEGGPLRRRLTSLEVQLAQLLGRKHRGGPPPSVPSRGPRKRGAPENR